MSDNANRLARILIALGKYEDAAFRMADKSAALGVLEQLSQSRRHVLQGIAKHNQERLGLTDETLSLMESGK